LCDFGIYLCGENDEISPRADHFQIHLPEIDPKEARQSQIFQTLCLALSDVIIPNAPVLKAETNIRRLGFKCSIGLWTVADKVGKECTKTWPELQMENNVKQARATCRMALKTAATLFVLKKKPSTAH